MTASLLLRATRNGSVALILAGLLGLGIPASANGQRPDNDKRNDDNRNGQPSARPAPGARRAAPVTRPSPQPSAPVSRPSFPPSNSPANPNPGGRPASGPPPGSGNRTPNGPRDGYGTRTPNGPAPGTVTPGNPPAGFGNRTPNGPRDGYGTRTPNSPANGFGNNNGSRNPDNQGGNGSSPRPTGFNNGNGAGSRNNGSHNPEFRTPPSRGSRDNTTRDGSAIRFRPNGKVSDVRDVRRGIQVHQGLNGSRRISVDRPDHSRAVFERGRPGFVQHSYNFRGHDFDRRTYLYSGRTYDHFYHGYRFRGLGLSVYAPSFFFGRDYYGWAYNPWAMPIHYRWGWMGNPWYRHFGFYFNPYPVYPSAAFWLTDYMISANLQAAYAAQQEAGEMNGDDAGGAGAAPLTPEVKQMIADEVRNQLALENQEAQQNAQQQDVDPGSSGIARMLSDAANGHPHVFVVGSALDVVDSSGMECSLSDGDALLLNTAPPSEATYANLVVLASKGGRECPKSESVSVPLDDLQEMQNQMRASIDQGLQELQANGGKDGLPVAPSSTPFVPATYASAAPPPDPNVSAEIQQESKQVEQAVNEVTADASQHGGAPTISAGQTIGEVESILGQPTNKAILGQKIIYNYNGMKVTFTGGKVTDVE